MQTRKDPHSFYILFSLVLFLVVLRADSLSAAVGRRQALFGILASAGATIVTSGLPVSALENQSQPQPQNETSINSNTMMKAVLQSGFGQPTQVLSISSQVPKPKLHDPNHILVKVHATCVNTPDWAGTLGLPYLLRPIMGGGGFFRPGKYSKVFKKDGQPRIIGSDVAGVVEEVGANVQHVKPGDEVFGSSGDDILGAFAEYAIVPSGRLIKKPKEMTMAQAAGSVMSGLTAQVVVDAAKIQPGMNVLINGASGGVGTFCVGMVKALGAKVTGVCSGKNADMVKSLGADEVIDYTKEDFTVTKEGTYDAIIDNVMLDPFKKTSKALKPDGFIVPNGIGARRNKWWGAVPFFFVKPSNYPTAECETNQERLKRLSDDIVAGKFKVQIDKIYSLDEAPSAVEHMASNRARGQVVIQVI